MMLEPVGEEDEADLLHQDDEGDQSGALLICFYHCNLCSKKTASFYYFSNNSVKNQPILIIFDI